MNAMTLRWMVIVAAMGFFIASLCLPAFSYVTHVPSDHVTSQVSSTGPGWHLFATGWFAIIFLEPAAFSWLANVTFSSAVIVYALGSCRSSALLAVLSMLFDASFFPISNWAPATVLFSGQGEAFNHPRPELGFVAWMVSLVIILAGYALSHWRTLRMRQAKER
jgi:hypothetical protein